MVYRWDSSIESAKAVIALNDGVVLLRELPSENALEAFDERGLAIARVTTRNPVLNIYEDRGIIYTLEEKAPGNNIVRRWNFRSGGVLETISRPRTWTDLKFTTTGRILGFVSQFLTRDRAPSAVRIRDVITDEVIFEDFNSYHYPLEMKSLMLLSPIDRKIRLIDGPFRRDVGTISSLSDPPVASHTGDYVAWFGALGQHSALYVADSTGRSTILISAQTEVPIAWSGDDLLVGLPVPGSNRWEIRRIDVPTGLVKGVIPVPNHVTLFRIAASRADKVIGLPLTYGSILIELDTQFLRELDDIPVSGWRFSPDGKTLYFVTIEQLERFDPKRP